MYTHTHSGLAPLLDLGLCLNLPLWVDLGQTLSQDRLGFPMPSKPDFLAGVAQNKKAIVQTISEQLCKRKRQWYVSTAPRPLGEGASMTLLSPPRL